MSATRIRRTGISAVLILAALAAPTAAQGSATRAEAATNRCTHADVAPAEATAVVLAEATLCAMNAERTTRGVHRLRASSVLARAGDRFAGQMADQQFFGHVSPGGSTLTSRVKATGYLRRAASWSLGENIAWGSGGLSTPRATVKHWMESPPHRANLLSRSFSVVGIGTAPGGGTTRMNPDQIGTTYVTDFGQRSIRHSRTS